MTQARLKAMFLSKMASKRRDTKKDQERIRQLLSRDWDPIGIAGVGPGDEYDEYVGRVYSMLINETATETAIAEYLRTFAMHQMLLAERDDLTERTKNTAKVLASMGAEFRDR